MVFTDTSQHEISCYPNLKKNNICEQLNKEKPQEVLPLICVIQTLEDLQLSFISPRQVCMFRHDSTLCAFHHK